MTYIKNCHSGHYFYYYYYYYYSYYYYYYYEVVYANLLKRTCHLQHDFCWC